MYSICNSSNNHKYCFFTFVSVDNNKFFTISKLDKY